MNITKKESRFIANCRLLEEQTFSLQTNVGNNFQDTVIDNEPVILHDLTGPELFHIYRIINSLTNNEVGNIWIAVNEQLSKRVTAFVPQKLNYNTESGIAWVQEQLGRELSHHSIESLLVCYSYPKFGLLVSIRDQHGHLETRRLFDFNDQVEVALDVEAGFHPSDGLMPSSILRRLPKRKTLQALPEHRWYMAYLPEGLALDQFNINDEIRETVSRLDFAGSEQKILDIPLYSQETVVWCAVASAQMILEYHGIRASQTEIAEAMNSGPSGTSNQNQMKGYTKLLGNNYEINFDETAEWHEAKREIDAGKPMKTGIPGHARVCAGWIKRSVTKPDGSSLLEQQLVVHDPWPMKKGELRFEGWDDEFHTNYIYIGKH